MLAVINRRLLYVFVAGGLCVLLVSFGCSTNSKQLHSERLQILNTLLQKYAEGDSIAVYEKSIQDISISLPKEKLTADYLSTDSLAIPEEDLKAWQKQWRNYRPVQWKKWGWNTDYLISREQFPEYYEYSVPPPGYELPSIKTDIHYFSIPLVGKKYAIIVHTIKRNKTMGVIVLDILKKKSDSTWVYHTSKGLLTS